MGMIHHRIGREEQLSSAIDPARAELPVFATRNRPTRIESPQFQEGARRHGKIACGDEAQNTLVKEVDNDLRGRGVPVFRRRVPNCAPHHSLRIGGQARFDRPQPILTRPAIVIGEYQILAARLRRAQVPRATGPSSRNLAHQPYARRRDGFSAIGDHYDFVLVARIVQAANRVKAFVQLLLTIVGWDNNRKLHAGAGGSDEPFLLLYCGCTGQGLIGGTKIRYRGPAWLADSRRGLPPISSTRPEKPGFSHLTGGEPLAYRGFVGLCAELARNHVLSLNSNLLPGRYGRSLRPSIRNG